MASPSGRQFSRVARKRFPFSFAFNEDEGCQVKGNPTWTPASVGLAEDLLLFQSLAWLRPSTLFSFPLDGYVLVYRKFPAALPIALACCQDFVFSKAAQSSADGFYAAGRGPPSRAFRAGGSRCRHYVRVSN